MRKKSHIKLASYLMKNLNIEDLNYHKKAFWVGSILPDCTPSFLTRRHTIDDTFELVRKEIDKLIHEYDEEDRMTGKYCRRLGVISHYLADYCTYPHNSIFKGNIKEHCIYESDLKRALVDYVNKKNNSKIKEQVKMLKSTEDICNYIKAKHEEYLLKIKNVYMDCKYIVELCQSVLFAIVQLFIIRVESKSLIGALAV